MTENQPGAESVCPYSDETPKGKQVEKMFDSIAPAYDFMNTAMTFGLHRVWRKAALKRAFSSGGMRRAMLSADGPRILDIASGTGDVAIAMAKALDSYGLTGEITGADLSEGMLEIARKKASALPAEIASMLTFEAGDCLNLSMADNTFDLVTVAYGVRNFQRLADGLKEMCRVLRPGGTICILELSVPSFPPLRLGYNLYSRTLIPLTGRLISGDSRAYTYLPESIAACPQRKEMTALMEAAGFIRCSYRSMTLGVVTLYLGEKPENNPETSNEPQGL
ncbi:MAG: bifunctional demethylmenaquinone methyltransferase/2-methoxy-6-polyprenyl-1,4-benzoquinol methylase UbiE [Muribaculaceae bacterium]|nr:bifunctional demethylmenaquinone methyltransferase/2-methoxy-6-polyprenyl-1,4-benzoquinol methylase UbiE [Muribaculaceae bacterium]